MPRVILALLRHGDYNQLPDTPSAWQPFALNQRGRQQATAATRELTRYESKLSCRIHPVIACSTLLRAWQTAEVIRSALPAYDLQSKQYPQLAERCVGSVANLSIEQINNVIDQDPRYSALPDNWKSDSFFCLPFPGAESLMQAGRRVADFLLQEAQMLWHSGGSRIKIIIGHGAAFRHAAYHLGVIELDHIAHLSMYHCRPVFLEYLDIDHWCHIAGEWKQRSLDSRFTD